ncbi:MAG: NAD(+) synthase [Candidatus Thorarchaeota archaeon]
MNFGFVRVSIAVPILKLTDIEENYQEHLKVINDLAKTETQMICFPELSLTGYSCGDLFHQNIVYNKVLEVLKKFETVSSSFPHILLVFGTPFPYQGALYNCAAIYNNGKLLALVPKTNLPTYNEFKEKIYFQKAPDTTFEINIPRFSHKVLFGRQIIFQSDTFDLFQVAIEICEDLWGVEPPSGKHSSNGALLLVNLSASNELIGKSEFRTRLVQQQSERCISTYCYVSSGLGESTMDLVFGGHGLIYENGKKLGEIERFSLKNQSLTIDTDLESLNLERIHNTIWGEYVNNSQLKYFFCPFHSKTPDFTANNLLRVIDPTPFTSFQYEKEKLDLRCKEILNIQAHGLAMRYLRSKSKNLVIGLSGGLDSTYALLVCLETCNILNLPSKIIHALTLPGPGTSEITKTTIINFCKEMKVNLEIISINEVNEIHLKQLGHDGRHDITYENSQARERTKILFDRANQVNGIVVGTSDLSELALGWATFNGDHMSSYAVNASIPKTLVKILTLWYLETKLENKKAKRLLEAIINMPITPELIPPDEKTGQITQKTEDKLGPFELHDFFIFNFIRKQFSPSKMFFLANIAFKDKYEKEDIRKWLEIFLKRFFANQFKRSCLPDGPKVGTVSLSPRGDWRIPSDVDSVDLWLNDLPK